MSKAKPIADAAERKPLLMVKCSNCLGSGTIFPGKKLTSKSKVCPVCKGSCKVPAEEPKV